MASTVRINPLYTAEEIAHQLKDAGARFLVTVPLFLEKAKAAARAANIEELFIFDEPGDEVGRRQRPSLHCWRATDTIPKLPSIRAKIWWRFLIQAALPDWRRA